MDNNPTSKHAVVYRMVMPEHICPFGRKTLYLLKKHGYEIDDHQLTTREDTDAFMAEYTVKTTPQTFIGGERIGGYEAVREYLGYTTTTPGETSYRPVIAIFAVAALLAVAVGLISDWAGGYELVIPRFVAFMMILLALQKLQDVESFSTMFLNYDVLAQRWVPYGYLYPFLELFAGVLMLSGVLLEVAVPVALLIGGIGAWSVFKAVYLEKRELKCACVGGNTNVPLGFVSLTENLLMLGMGLWMGAALLA